MNVGCVQASALWTYKRLFWRTDQCGTDLRTHVSCEVEASHPIRPHEVLSRTKSPSASSEGLNLDSKDLSQVRHVHISCISLI